MTLISLDNEQLTLIDISKYNRLSCIIFFEALFIFYSFILFLIFLSFLYFLFILFTFNLTVSNH